MSDTDYAEFPFRLLLDEIGQLQDVLLVAGSGIVFHGSASFLTDKINVILAVRVDCDERHPEQQDERSSEDVLGCFSGHSGLPGCG
jgi:hypothetical protein